MSGSATGKKAPGTSGVAARKLAADAIVRIDTEGAYANLLVPSLLDAAHLDARDRAFVTELVYGATRMKRACDWLVDRFVLGDLDPLARALLRLGAYQLAFLATPPHAALNATVEAAPRKLRGLVNAVLRKVADAGVPVRDEWPDLATRLSYPNWMIDRLVADLGEPDAISALEAMNESARATERADGYTQDLASQWVADAVEAHKGELVLDVCAAPGGKATSIASGGARVVAGDVRPSRAGLVAKNAAGLRLEAILDTIVADGLHPPFRAESFDHVLVDAPCSGLGALRRRPDARWRIKGENVGVLAALQRGLVDAALPLVKVGGTIVYSVCTLTRAETIDVDEHLAATHPELLALDPPGEPWRALGRGALLLPQTAGTDGMYVLRLRRTA